MAKTLDEILDEADDFGLLHEPEKPAVRTDDDRLLAVFEEINSFLDKNNREPSAGRMAEYSLFARLKGIRADGAKAAILKQFDRHRLLEEVTVEIPSLDSVLQDDSGLLEPQGDPSVFEFRHTPHPEKRAQADYVAKRKKMPEEEFEKYEVLFRQVHQDLKEGKRRMLPFDRFEDNLKEGNFYLMDGLLLFLETAEAASKLHKLNSGSRYRIDGRTHTIFENGTLSNMLFRSLGKAIQHDKGKLITAPDYEPEIQDAPASVVAEEDIESGWIYVLKSLSSNPEIAAQQELYKVGFSSKPVSERIKNASREAAYLFGEVELIASYKCFNMNPQKLELLLHRFLGECCLDLDVFDKKNNRYSPREWFVVPLRVIELAIQLIIAGTINNYKLDLKTATIISNK